MTVSVDELSLSYFCPHTHFLQRDLVELMGAPAADHDALFRQDEPPCCICTRGFMLFFLPLSYSFCPFDTQQPHACRKSFPLPPSLPSLLADYRCEQ
jgi:hypothetical protein